MKEVVIKKEGEVQESDYRCWFRCSNCGAIFQYDLSKGRSANLMSGYCPLCGVKSGAPTIGRFSVIKFNPKYDGNPPDSYYFK